MKFDDDQLAVIRHTDGALLVVAGAGSGKTATIIGRAVRMIESGINPKNHLMLTFSKKAADEMRGRIAKNTDQIDLKEMFIGTFHSFGYKLLRENPIACNRAHGVTILDEKDVDRILSDLWNSLCLEEYGVTDEDFLKKLSSIYSMGCNGLLDISDSGHDARYNNLLEKNGLASEDQKSIFFKLFNRYELKKRNSNVVDFDDLITLPTHALRRNLSWRNNVASRYQYLTVDEGQDANKAQMQFVGQLSVHSNIVLVGDDDQSIYSWRGANPGNMTWFKSKFNAKVLLLSRNYRSTESIIVAAAFHVSKNTNRFSKNISAMIKGGVPIKYIDGNTSDETASRLVESIQTHVNNGGKYSDIAILYRANKIVKLLEYELISNDVPYKVVGGISFENRVEIRFAIAIARLVLNPLDQSAFRTVCEMTPGIGDASIKKIIESSEMSGKSFFETDVNVGVKITSSLEKLNGIILFLREIGGPEALIAQILDENGLDILSQFNEKQAATMARKRILLALDELIYGWIKDRTTDSTDWEVFFEKICGGYFEEKTNGNVVTLSTIHKSKGLEWKFVHLFGYSDGLIPLIKRNNENEKSVSQSEIECKLDEEEERRLSYVGITRAMEECTLWHCAEYDYGYVVNKCNSSRFINELFVN
jgi:DNA helicase-2/ATP-dependent DNA helicase PcrA